MQDVRDQVAAVQPSFPRDAKAPYVARFDGENAQPTVVLSLLGDDAQRARAVAARRPGRQASGSQRVDGVARVDVGGLTVRQVRIDLDPQRLRAYAADAGRRRDGAAATPTPTAGRACSPDAKADAIVRVEGRCATPRRFADIVVARRNGLALTARRPRHAGRARARARLDLAHQRRAGDLLPGLQAAGRQHRRDRRGDQGGDRGAAQDAAARRRAAPRSTPTATGSSARSTACSTR